MVTGGRQRDEEVKEECTVAVAVMVAGDCDAPSSHSTSSSLPLSTFDVECKAPPSSPTSRRFINRLCCLDFVGSFGLYLILITLASVIALHVQPPTIGLVMLSLLPAFYILSYLRRCFSKSVLPLQIAFTFFESILYMCPIGKRQPAEEEGEEEKRRKRWKRRGGGADVT